MQTHKKQRVVIAGGGSAGWMTASALSKLIGKNLDISLIESDEIGRIGVGEATIPPLRVFNELLGINEQDFMRSTQATFKLGIQFQNWGLAGDSYIHSFGATGKECWAGGFQHFWTAGLKEGILDKFGDYCLELKAAEKGKFGKSSTVDFNYAYHLDAGLYAEYLKKFAMDLGVKRFEGIISDVEINGTDGFIKSVQLKDGQTIAGDLFIDCTGFIGRLIEGAMNTGFDSYGHLIPCDSAIAVQTELVREPRPYTQAIAHDYGWQWRIPLQHRVGNGLVFCSRYVSDDEATAKLLENLDAPTLTEPMVLKYNTGRRLKGWNKNCVAIGLSSGFVEPVESTAIHLMMSAILRLMKLFPHQQIKQSNIDEYNRQYKLEMELIRDFIILHYKATDREDAKFWQYCKNMEVPDSLAHRMQLFKDTGRIIVTDEIELFRVDSWSQVMIGQGIIPQQYHQIVDMMKENELARFLDTLKNSVNHNVEQMLSHQEFINNYCKADPI